MRLIDADTLSKRIMWAQEHNENVTVLALIADAPTECEKYRSFCMAKQRPQGEYVDISKLRLMTVEECAGHTIDYAMGWKACVEWIKKGGAE